MPASADWLSGSVKKTYCRGLLPPISAKKPPRKRKNTPLPIFICHYNNISPQKCQARAISPYCVFSSLQCNLRHIMIPSAIPRNFLHSDRLQQQVVMALWCNFYLPVRLLFYTFVCFLGLFFLVFKNCWWTFFWFVSIFYRYICNYLTLPVFFLWFQRSSFAAPCTNFHLFFLHIDILHNLSKNPWFSVIFTHLFLFMEFIRRIPEQSHSPAELSIHFIYISVLLSTARADCEELPPFFLSARSE